MFCPYCGNQLASADAAFCMNCGKKIPNNTQQPEMEKPSIEQPKAPQYTQPQAPASGLGNTPISIKPKRNPIWILVAVVIIVGAVFAAYMFFGKSDEQKIRDRIDDFEDACSDMDIEGMLECFDGRTRRQYDAMMGVTEGILGEVTGFDLPYGDMVGLMDINPGEDYDIDIEIHSINIDDDTASVEVTIYQDGTTSESSTITMCEEDGDWYIDMQAMTGGLNYF